MPIGRRQSFVPLSVCYVHMAYTSFFKYRCTRSNKSLNVLQLDAIEKAPQHTVYIML